MPNYEWFRAKRSLLRFRYFGVTKEWCYFARCPYESRLRSWKRRVVFVHQNPQDNRISNDSLFHRRYMYTHVYDPQRDVVNVDFRSDRHGVRSFTESNSTRVTPKIRFREDTERSTMKCWLKNSPPRIVYVCDVWVLHEDDATVVSECRRRSRKSRSATRATWVTWKTFLPLERV